MGLQAAVHLGHMPWALTKEEEEAFPDLSLLYHISYTTNTYHFNNKSSYNIAQTPQCSNISYFCKLHLH
jgi:hypothetical protein